MLVTFRRIVNGDKALMGYLYEAMDRAKEAIQHLYRSNETKYRPIWNIIDCRWNRQVYQHHATAYYLNPESFSLTLFEQMQRFKLAWTHVFGDWLLIWTFETSSLMSYRATRGKRGHCFLHLIANVGDTPYNQVKKYMCFVLLYH